METLTIKYPPGSKAILLQRLEELSKLGVVIENSSAGEEFERIPGLPYTREERIASVRRAETDYAAGRFVSSEELRAKHPRI